MKRKKKKRPRSVPKKRARKKPIDTRALEEQGGRPEKPLPSREEMVRKLAGLMCTNKEIADVVGVSESLVSKRYSRIIEVSESNRKRSLRNAMWVKALGRKVPLAPGETDGNITMQIFLAKQYLAMRDTPEDVSPDDSAEFVKYVAKWGDSTIADEN